MRLEAVNNPEARCSIKLESQATCQGAGKGRGADQFTKPVFSFPKDRCKWGAPRGCEYLVMTVKWVKAGTQTMPLPALLNVFSTVGPKDVHVSGPAPSPPPGWPPGLSLVRNSFRGDIRELQYELWAHGPYVMEESHALTFATTKQNTGMITHAYNPSA